MTLSLALAAAAVTVPAVAAEALPPPVPISVPEVQHQQPIAPEAPPPPAPTPAPPPAASDEIIVTGQGAPPGDPAEKINVVSFQVVQGVDKALVAPIAIGYTKVTPKPVRQGVHNLLNNLNEPVNFINSLLQFKFGRAVKTLGRFVINSTIGVAGLFDLASKKPFGIEYARNGFANTLGFYGVGSGPYMFLPLIGPTTLRDLAGRVMDLSIVPGVAGKPFNSPAYAMGTGVARSVDDRVEMDAFLRKLHSECSNPYAAEREYYLGVREAEIEALHGRKLDLSARMPACLADATMVRVGQAVPPADTSDTPEVTPQETAPAPVVQPSEAPAAPPESQPAPAAPVTPTI